eukprot:TRINITY_DN2270_c0_g1_i1.p1 TRINITY_DN2270_c0_g1~~TRINITY_DN2270_c0_g1_i1.p1  ORF type:complete len:724 (-),score=117.84 TRINITY_DN2270_c0_g1_i1:157-2328(-)
MWRRATSTPARRWGLGAVGAGLVGGYYLYNKDRSVISTRIGTLHEHQQLANWEKPGRIPSRAEQLLRLKDDKEFDLLVIGGGATGVGVALDAQTRGLKVALVECDDFSAGTSSRSTKLIHGGVRYLEKAFRELDIDQYNLVHEALRERANLLLISPHLSYELPIMLPIYRWWQVPYYWAGAKAYDFLAGKKSLESSYYMNKTRALEKFPMLKQEKLVGAIVYYDGQHNDSRMGVSIALTAAGYGAALANHVEAVSLLKKKTTAEADGAKVETEQVCGAMVRDTLTGEMWQIRAKGVINATGPFVDTIRQMDNKNAEKFITTSAGVHIILPDYYSPMDMGMLDPSTSDGRVIFFLPWQGATIAGTTDTPTSLTHFPAPLEQEVSFILSEVKHYLSADVKVRRGDVLAAWSGIRPLVKDPKKTGTQALARNHVVLVSESNLISIAGGKWTTYRMMAEDTVDKAIEILGLKPTSECKTKGLTLIGGHNFTPTMYISLIQKYGIEKQVARHLCESYGDRAVDVLKYAEQTGLRWPVIGKRLHPLYPYLEAEVDYAVNYEYACTAIDVMARRTRLAFLDANASSDVLAFVVDRMTGLLGWSPERRQKELNQGYAFLHTMGLVNTESPVNYNAMDLIRFREAFDHMDSEKSGYLTTSQVKRMIMYDMGEKVSETQLQEYMKEAEGAGKAQGIDYNEFLQIMSRISPPSLPQAQGPIKKLKSPTRSGGGV